MEALGSILHRERLLREVSQSALARRTGVSQPAISRIESGAEVPSLERFRRLLSGLGLRLDLELEPLAIHRGEPAHREAVMRMTPGERLEQASAWSGFASELRGKAAAA
ncbi:MAG: helix-turn-helix domain-containing protein [Actinomycetota bacterium]|nr:helix-turn-helix domain-containing protein [Actinomycetota bacterium]